MHQFVDFKRKVEMVTECIRNVALAIILRPVAEELLAVNENTKLIFPSNVPFKISRFISKKSLKILRVKANMGPGESMRTLSSFFRKIYGIFCAKFPCHLAAKLMGISIGVTESSAGNRLFVGNTFLSLYPTARFGGL
ncbi:hypothetical protein ABLO27_11990 [Roseibium sp. SCPC15]|uniref:hypothetical protein n=1 Tax=Roseibium sp. SCP15 TaxID=3141376 RepID=UPI00333D738F